MMHRYLFMAKADNFVVGFARKIKPSPAATIFVATAHDSHSGLCIVVVFLAKIGQRTAIKRQYSSPTLETHRFHHHCKIYNTSFCKFLQAFLVRLASSLLEPHSCNSFFLFFCCFSSKIPKP